MTSRRFAVFIVVVMSVWTAMHVYVFWRLASIPWVADHVARSGVVWTAVGLAASFPLARLLNARRLTVVGRPLEFVAANWVGMLFLLLAMLLAADVITAGGWLFPRLAPGLRGAAAVVALLLAAVAWVQGMRPPVVTRREVRLAGLPKERDGFALVAVSDLHLGSMIGEAWMRRLIARLNELKPDAVVIVGDLVDSEVGALGALLPVLRTLRAPLGVWAVTGNHEYYAGIDRSVALLEAAGYTVLRDRAVEIAPGLVIAGVDDLGARRQFGRNDPAIEQALANRPPGAVILLSHSPVQADAAAALGAGLMLSGHTHNGQIWPFNYIVRLSNPLVGGRYEVGGMTVIVGRGTGTWGPRMRLWQPGEILLIKLRAE
jgi:predicted MPP superfamily phosphohydrolase